MSNPENYHFTLNQADRPHFMPLNQEMHPSFHWLTQNRSRSRKRDIYSVIDTIVIHATAGYATQHAVDNWKQRTASAHWIVPDEDEPQHGHFVWATVLEAKAAYHVGGSHDYRPILGDGVNVNNRSLGIEIVNTQDVQNHSDPFSDWQIKSTAQIVLHAWAKYPNLKHVISHAKLDPSRRSDPGPNFPWQTFKNLVLSQAALEPENHLINTEYEPPEPHSFDGNCCGP